MEHEIGARVLKEGGVRGPPRGREFVSQVLYEVLERVHGAAVCAPSQRELSREDAARNDNDGQRGSECEVDYCVGGLVGVEADDEALRGEQRRARGVAHEGLVKERRDVARGARRRRRAQRRF